jgi:hypothetical protein
MSDQADLDPHTKGWKTRNFGDAMSRAMRNAAITKGSTYETNPRVALARRLIARVMPYGTGVDGESARIQVEK